MTTKTQITKKHIGLDVYFRGFDDRVYCGKIINVKCGTVIVAYDVISDSGAVLVSDVVTYLDRPDHTRLELAA